MKKPIAKEKVIALLVKRGSSKCSAEETVAKHFGTAILCYPEARASKIADFCLWAAC